MPRRGAHHFGVLLKGRYCILEGVFAYQAHGAFCDVAVWNRAPDINSNLDARHDARPLVETICYWPSVTPEIGQ